MLKKIVSIPPNMIFHITVAMHPHVRTYWFKESSFRTNAESATVYNSE